MGELYFGVLVRSLKKAATVWGAGSATARQPLTAVTFAISWLA
ncbi:hypothetical protein [Microvirga sp. VF16]|nr:hypothetical protein [Microvirga sp. VF16]